MTQPDDPRRVTVIVELIDHTRGIAELHNRADLSARLDEPGEVVEIVVVRAVVDERVNRHDGVEELPSERQ